MEVGFRFSRKKQKKKRESLRSYFPAKWSLQFQKLNPLVGGLPLKNFSDKKSFVKKRNLPKERHSEKYYSPIVSYCLFGVN